MAIKRLPKVLYDAYESSRGDLRLRKFERIKRSEFYLNRQEELLDGIYSSFKKAKSAILARVNEEIANLQIVRREIMETTKETCQTENDPFA